MGFLMESRLPIAVWISYTVSPFSSLYKIVVTGYSAVLAIDLPRAPVIMPRLFLRSAGLFWRSLSSSRKLPIAWFSWIVQPFWCTYRFITATERKWRIFTKRCNFFRCLWLFDSLVAICKSQFWKKDMYCSKELYVIIIVTKLSDRTFWQI